MTVVTIVLIIYVIAGGILWKACKYPEPLISNMPRLYSHSIYILWYKYIYMMIYKHFLALLQMTIGHNIFLICYIYYLASNRYCLFAILTSKFSFRNENMKSGFDSFAKWIIFHHISTVLQQ